MYLVYPTKVALPLWRIPSLYFVRPMSTRSPGIVFSFPSAPSLRIPDPRFHGLIDIHLRRALALANIQV